MTESVLGGRLKRRQFNLSTERQKKNALKRNHAPELASEVWVDKKKRRYKPTTKFFRMNKYKKFDNNVIDKNRSHEVKLSKESEEEREITVNQVDS